GRPDRRRVEADRVLQQLLEAGRHSHHVLARSVKSTVRTCSGNSLVGSIQCTVPAASVATGPIDLLSPPMPESTQSAASRLIVLVTCSASRPRSRVPWAPSG